MKSTTNLTVEKDESEARLYLPSIPAAYRKTYVKATMGKVSKAAAIKAKCNDCMGYENAHRRVRECTCKICPLWAVRPYQKTQAEKRSLKVDRRENVARDSEKSKQT